MLKRLKWSLLWFPMFKIMLTINYHLSTASFYHFMCSYAQQGILLKKNTVCLTSCNLMAMTIQSENLTASQWLIWQGLNPHQVKADPQWRSFILVFSLGTWSITILPKVRGGHHHRWVFPYWVFCLLPFWKINHCCLHNSQQKVCKYYIIPHSQFVMNYQY